MMQVMCRAMGTHRLTVLPFYTYLLKYIIASQLRIPTILAALASSVHSLTPPDVLTPVIRKIAHEFVHPGVGSEVVAAGLNSIREICVRQPWAMEEDLLSDLVEYKKSKDKGVIAGARGLLHLYRQEAPSMLKRRERVSWIYRTTSSPTDLSFLGQGSECKGYDNTTSRLRCGCELESQCHRRLKCELSKQTTYSPNVEIFLFLRSFLKTI